MKSKFAFSLFSLVIAGSASAQGLYYVGSEAQESIPLKWVVGGSVTYDDNVSPGFGKKESSFGLNPYVGLSFVNITPQTTWDVYARLGMIYYLDAPAGMDDVSSQSRAGINLTHRFSERLRFSSRNFVSYELEPDYSYGYASSRQAGEYFFWQTDNSIGFRWSERFATYTGARLSGTTYTDVSNNDRFTWELYNQLRYQLGPQTVLTGDYRYAQTYGDGVSTDSTDQYILGGVEQRFSPNTIGIVRAGVQLRNVDATGGSSTSSPYLELALNSQVNEQFRVRAFTRYGIESYDTVEFHPVAGLVEFDDRRTLRVGVSADYVISPMLSLFGGVDYIPTSYQSGRSVSTPPFVGSISDVNEDMINAYVGLSVKFNDYLTGTASYNYTNSSSDIAGRDYNRNRISVGLSTEF
ncbi:MAG: outer membrane beta-barrel protein [Luteolibacter sp.]